eukprot:CAMPEP_0198724594 /NCGR_PEP_ID=MMETSP1475-20131203/2051_1 /TAXON_ID= ORGANISM="Unidentified sp., Strain CCMP1999" /NCGR_SAMPLE_ID=MMETSP1475 /ASSEMBLY_ACC=CAM_ASM_001111 /LENGTH=425 /DNA_ID=CAMNT_0044486169 /DNA_START=478 /DNA_END=1755 /DNA_ORIENTATION=-
MGISEKPTVYSGQLEAGLLENFIDQVEVFCLLERIDGEKQKILTAASFLKGVAYTWWRLVKRDATKKPDTFDEFVALLREQFGPLDDDLMAQNELVKLRQTGSLGEYINEFVSITLRIPDMTEAEKFDRFHRGLKPYLQEKVLVQSDGTLASAMQCASLIVSVQQYVESNTTEKQTASTQSASSAATRQQPRKDYSGVTCYVCNKTGHTSRVCKQNPNRVTKTTTSKARNPGAGPSGEIPQDKFVDISMDFVTGLPLTDDGQDSIMVIVDRLTKMATFIATNATANAQQTAKLFLHHYVCRYGLPQTIVSGRDLKFTSRFWKELMTLMGVKLHLSTAFRPQTDGQTERTNRTMETLLRTYARYKTWSQQLALIEFTFNNSSSATTKQTPFYSVYGKHPRVPADLMQPGKATDASQALQDFVQNHN